MAKKRKASDSKASPKSVGATAATAEGSPPQNTGVARALSQNANARTGVAPFNQLDQDQQQRYIALDASVDWGLFQAITKLIAQIPNVPLEEQVELMDIKSHLESERNQCQRDDEQIQASLHPIRPPTQPEIDSAKQIATTLDKLVQDATLGNAVLSLTSSLLAIWRSATA